MREHTLGQSWWKMLQDGMGSAIYKARLSTATLPQTCIIKFWKYLQDWNSMDISVDPYYLQPWFAPYLTLRVLPFRLWIFFARIKVRK